MDSGPGLRQLGVRGSIHAESLCGRRIRHSPAGIPVGLARWFAENRGSGHFAESSAASVARCPDARANDCAHVATFPTSPMPRLTFIGRPLITDTQSRTASASFFSRAARSRAGFVAFLQAKYGSPQVAVQDPRLTTVIATS